MFKNQTVLITGAAVGIGKACAVQFAKGGANVVLVDINLEALQKTEQEVKKLTDSVAAFVCNVADNEDVCLTVEKAIRQFGRIDILVNNAGLWRNQSNFVDTPVELWKTYLDVNVMGAVYVTKAVLPKMMENRFGRIINVASVAGVYGIARMAHYSATKGALISFTKALARELSEYSITVNAVSPGTVSPAEADDIDYVQPSEMSYSGRTGSTKENADLICFLASDKAGYINGQNIQIDGCRKKI